MAFWTDKKGEKLSLKQFIARWKEGINNITPGQSTKAVLYGHWILIFGIVWGLIYSFIQGFYWLSAIMTGALIINIFGLIGVIQRNNFIRKTEEEMKRYAAEIPVTPNYVA